MGGALLLLSILVLAFSALHQIGLSRVVDQRLAPVSDLEQVATYYNHSLSIGNKVNSGNLTPEGGASALRTIQREIAQEWRSLDGNADDISDAVTTLSRSSRDIAAALGQAQERTQNAVGRMDDLSERARALLSTARELELIADTIADQTGSLDREYRVLTSTALDAA